MRTVRENSSSLILLHETVKKALRIFLDKSEIRKVDNFLSCLWIFLLISLSGVKSGNMYQQWKHELSLAKK